MSCQRLINSRYLHGIINHMVYHVSKYTRVYPFIAFDEPLNNSKYDAIFDNGTA